MACQYHTRICSDALMIDASYFVSVDRSIIAGLLLTSQLHGASQLSAWCLHFISSNYVVFKDKEDFSKLTGENLDYVNDHRWPPLSYERAMEDYKRKYLAEEEGGNENAGASCEHTGDNAHNTDSDTGKLDKCTVS